MIKQLTCLLILLSALHVQSKPPLTLEALEESFRHPDSSKWGINPFWWWEAEPITRERITWQMEKLSKKGVKNLTLIQRAPGHCDPAVFTDEWWELLNYTLEEARRLNMRIFLSDHLGYGETGFMEQIITGMEDPGVWDVRCQKKRAGPGKTVNLNWGDGRVLGVRAYPMLEGGVLDDENSIDLLSRVEGTQLDWTVPNGGGNWSVVVVLAIPPAELDEHYVPFSPGAARLYIEGRLDDLEARVPKDMLGQELAGFFGDEHPHFPHYVYTDAIADIYHEDTGGELARALPALFFDLGPNTVSYRIGYYDAAVEASERAYWRPVFEWCQERGLEYGNDQAQRRNASGQIDKYFDYVKTMRWYSAPGQDDPEDGPLGSRNYHGFKQAASIKELYGRSRVWNEAFYSSGVGIHPGNHLAWITENAAYGANLYNPHNYFYSNRAGTWTHTDGGWFWRQPYWAHYQAFSDYVTRLSMIGSLGHLVTDIAIHYPAVSIQNEPLVRQGKRMLRKPGDANGFMAVSEALFFANMDNLIIDDDKLLASEIKPSGQLVTGPHRFSTLIFGPETVIRLSVLHKALELVDQGGHVVFCGRLPIHSAEGGADDPQVKQLLEKLLGQVEEKVKTVRQHSSGGSAAFFPVDFSPLTDPDKLKNRRNATGKYPKLYGVDGASPRGKTAFQELRDQLAEVTDYTRTFAKPNFTQEKPALVIGFQRKIVGHDFYMVQSLEEHPVTFDAIFAESGSPRLWDPWTGTIQPVENHESVGGGTRVRLKLPDNLGYFIVFDDLPQKSKSTNIGRGEPVTVELPDNWTFQLEPTLDNQWGDFRFPASETSPAVEVTTFRYHEAEPSDKTEQWRAADYDDSGWQTVEVGVGPYWECARLAEPLPNLEALQNIKPDWRPVSFSKAYGSDRLITFRGQIGAAIADGVVLPDFILKAPEPYAVFRTYIVSPEKQDLGLSIYLRQKSARLWVNGVEQVVEYGTGNLPLVKGRNSVVVALEEPSMGQLYVTDTVPAATSLAVAQEPVIPPLDEAYWIREEGEPSWSPTRLKREFTLDQEPVEARVTLTAFPDYKLWINGQEVLSNTRHYMHNSGSGNWLLPRSANITPLLQQGKNVIEVEVALDRNQYFADTRWRPDQKKLVLALSVKMQDGSIMDIVSDADWPGATDMRKFVDTRSSRVILENRELAMATPEYPLGIELETPLLTVFDEHPEIAYDVREEDADRIGWFRFEVPPSTSEIQLPITEGAQLWINGERVPLVDGVGRLPVTPEHPAVAALRLEMLPGAYAGAALPTPVRLTLEPGKRMPVGDWQKLGMPIYSGIGKYRQTFSLSPEQLSGAMLLDLGRVGVSAHVFANGETVGIRMSAPYQFDISDFIVPGENTIEIEVANTTAPFFSTTPIATRRKTFAPYSGLLGPVQLVHLR